MLDIPSEDRLAIQGARCAVRVPLRHPAVRCDRRTLRRGRGLDETSAGLPLAEGRPVIDEVFRRNTDSGPEYVFHINSNHVITKFDGETATGTSHVYAFSRFEGVHTKVAGYYDDQYVKQAGAWRFKHRTLVQIAPMASLSAE